MHVVEATSKRDTLTVLNEVYEDFHALLIVQRGANESFKNYESQFAALVSRFNAHGLSLHLSEPILAFMPTTSAGIANNHRVSMLAAASNDVCIKEEGEWSGNQAPTL